MNILIIGNGFDLAHGLRTKYVDFLKYVNAFKRLCCEQIRAPFFDQDREDYNENIEYFPNFSDLHENNIIIYEEMKGLISDNVWIEYFQDICDSKKEAGKDGWIDFESEISCIIQALDGAKLTIRDVISQGQTRGKMSYRQFCILAPFFDLDENASYKSVGFDENEIEHKKEIFLNDLNRLIRCLEIYLSSYIGSFVIKNRLQDIEHLPHLDKVLSFNYTKTYERLYDKHENIEYDYIHGKARLDNTAESNNMVLGIDEYLDDSRKNIDIDFIEFKKYYQRIHKETGCLYREWIDEIKSSPIAYDPENPYHVIKHQVFIFGHSLDITDKDVLRDLILNDNVQTTIFYLDKNDYGRKIANLVRIIGQDELIRRTGGKTKTIIFRKIAQHNAAD